MRRFAYELLDSFTGLPSGGNLLAVFPEATGPGACAVMGAGERGLP